MSDRESPVSRLDERNVAATRANMGVNVHSHPEFDKPTTIDNMVAAAKSVWARMHPVQKPAAPKSAIPKQTDAEKEATARKYVD